MGLQALIAEPGEILRTGLRTILHEDERITHVQEACTPEELRTQLRMHSFDIVIVNQALITDISLLSQRRFVILAPEFDQAVFQAAYRSGARGYLLENISSELLLSTLSLQEGAFLIEPSLSVAILERQDGDQRFAISEDVLTPREREILHLLRSGESRCTIAQRLHISQATLKTHLKNMARKRNETEEGVRAKYKRAGQATTLKYFGKKM